MVQTIQNSKFIGDFYVCRDYVKAYPGAYTLPTMASSTNFGFPSSLYPILGTTFTYGSMPPLPASKPKPAYKRIDGEMQVLLTCTVATQSTYVLGIQEMYYGSQSALSIYFPSAKVAQRSSLITKALTNISKWEF